MSARLVERCGGCGGKHFDLVLSLGSSPPTCAMALAGPLMHIETHYPLELLQCGDCTLVQLSCIVDAEVVFPQDYPYSSGNSRALHQNFEDLARQVTVAPGDLVVDIGANDGTLLSKFEGCRTVGVEPTRQAERIDANDVYEAFFSEALAEDIVAEHGKANVVTACNVLAHVDDIGDVMRGIAVLLGDDGVLVAENHDLASVVDGGQWDTVYHEHLRFWDPYSFYRVLNSYGLLAERWQQIPTHGGSFRAVASKRAGTPNDPMPRRHYDFKALAEDAGAARAAIRAMTAPTTMVGIGATARATTIINYCGLDVQDIECVCEVAGSDKIGRYIPGTRIPVVDEAILFEDQSDAVLFSWHLADSIVPKLRERGYGGEIIVPLPYLHEYRLAAAA